MPVQVYACAIICFLWWQASYYLVSTYVPFKGLVFHLADTFTQRLFQHTKRLLNLMLESRKKISKLMRYEHMDNMEYCSIYVQPPNMNSMPVWLVKHIVHPRPIVKSYIPYAFSIVRHSAFRYACLRVLINELRPCLPKVLEACKRLWKGKERIKIETGLAFSS